MASNLTSDQFDALRHWSSFGQRGQASENRVGPSDRRTTPFKKPVQSSWNVKVPSSELTKLINGFAPRQMEDKWFVYTDGPDASGNAITHMFRSWTGFKVMEMKLKVALDEDGETADRDAEIIEFTWETSEEIVKYSSEEEAKSEALEVCNWVLGVKLATPK